MDFSTIFSRVNICTLFIHGCYRDIFSFGNLKMEISIVNSIDNGAKLKWRDVFVLDWLSMSGDMLPTNLLSTMDKR